MKNQSFKSLLPWALVSLLFVAFCSFRHKDFKSWYAVDFYQFWLPGQWIAHLNLPSFYTHEDRKAIHAAAKTEYEKSQSVSLRELSSKDKLPDLPGTPLLYAIASTFATGDYDFDQKIFYGFWLSVFFGGIGILCFLLKFPAWQVGALWVYFALYFWPFRMNVIVGNISGLQTGIICLLVAALKSKKAALHGIIGFIFGILALTKPTIGYIFPLLGAYWVWHGLTKKLISYGIGGLVGTIVGFLWPYLVFGPNNIWLSWKQEFPAMLYTDWYLTGGFLGKLLGLKNVPTFGYFGLALMGLTLFWLFKTRLREENIWLGEVGMVGMGLSIYLLSGPIVHSHYFLLSIPLLLLILRPRSFRPNSKFFLGGGIFALILLGSHPLFKSWGWTNWPNHSLLTFLGVIILVGLTIIDLHHLRKRA